MTTDLDLQVVESIPPQVITPGATIVSAHTLFDIAPMLPEGSQVGLSVDGNRMSVVAGRARFSLATLPRDDFPVIAESDLPHRIVPAQALKRIIDRTRFAISTEETHCYLIGVR